MTVPTLLVRPQGPIGKFADWCFIPITHLATRTLPSERAQMTHRWNNHHLAKEDVAHLNPWWMVSHEGDLEAGPVSRWPVVSGIVAHLFWRNYIVIEPLAHSDAWYVGWKWEGGAGVSRIPVKGPVRVLLGPGAVKWFGIASEGILAGHQIRIGTVGAPDMSAQARINDGGEYRRVPLF